MAKQNKEEQFRSIIFNDPLKIRQDEEKNQAPANVKVEYRDGPVKEHIEYDHATGTKTIVKSTIPKTKTSSTPKTNTKQSTTPAPFKPRTLLETTITRGNDNTKVNTNNRFESRFIPRTERNSNADSLSQIDRFLSLVKKEIENNKKEIELAKNNPNSLYYKQNYKKHFYDIEERGYKEGVTKELNELASGLNEPKIRENVNGKLTEAEAYIVNGMQDYEKNSANDAHNIGEVNEYGFAPAQFMSEQEINNYMYLRGKYDEYIADLYYLKTDAYHKYNKEISSAKTSKGFYEKVKENPAIGYIAIPTLTVASGIMGLMAGAEQTINKVTGDNTVNFIDEEAAFKTDAIGMTEQAIQDSTDNKFLKFAHSAGTELAEELGENMLPGGEIVWGTGSGIARKYTELAQYGVDLSSTEAYIAAMTSGGMNAVDLKFTKSGGQKIGKYLTRNMKGGTLKTIIGNTAGSVLSGMGAQVSRAVIDDIVDATILNDKGRYATVYKQYTEDGLTAEEANKKAILDAYVTPVVDAAVIGGIFGAAVSVPNTVSASVDFTKRGTNIKNEFYRFNVNDRLIEDAVIKQGLKQDKNSDAYKNAKLLENKVNNKRVLSNSEIGAQDILNQIEVYKTYEYSRAMEELTGARIELGADLPPEADGSYSKGTIKVSANSEGDARTTIKHEGGHLLKDGASDIYNAYEARLKDNITFAKVTNHIKSQYDRLGKNISQELLESEASAEIGRLLMPKTADDVRRLIRRVEGNRTLYDRIHNGIRALRTFMYAKGKKTFVDPETGFKMNYGEMLKLEKTLEEALVKVRGAEFKGGEAKNLIKKIDGTDKLYVKADRQVIKGDTPEEWGKSVESYINDTIRQGKDVEFIGADGDVLTITADTSGKAKFRNNITRPDGRITPMNDAEYMTKLTAESHIDELAEVSKRGKYWVPDSKNHDFAKDGFNYRTAYFEDFDGKYYRLTISVGKNGEIKSVYNVGKIKEVPSNFVAQRPGATKTPSSATSKNIVPENADGVKYKLKSPDVIKYGKNIENVFRDMRLSNVTDDEIKGFAGVTRQMIDYVINARDYSADDFVTQLDETVDAEVSKGSRSIGETIDITNTIIYEIRHISLADIGKREASAYTTMQTEAAAGRATGEVYANARAELNDLRKRKAIITGVFSEPPKNRGEYALSSVGKKSYKIMPDAKNKAEFDASVEDRLDKFVYRVTSNEESAEYGMKYVATHDNDDTLTYLENKTAWDEYDMATAAALVGEFNALGESERAAELLSVLSARATQAGKTAQATSHVYKLNASGKIEWWIKSNERATERDINSRDNKNALNAKEAECKVADARERAAAKELLSESDTEYRKLSDEESRLKKDLAARNEGKKKALQLQIELEERKVKADKDAELISRMLDADKRAQARRAERVREERHRELLKKLEVGDDEINRIMAEAKESPEEYDEFFMLMDAYYEVSGRAAKDLLKEVYNPKDRQKIIDALKEQKTLNTEILEEIENEYGAVKKPSEYEAEMKALRRKVLEIRKAKRMLEEDAIMNVIRVNDDGEIDPDGEHYVSTNPDATAWETKKATGKRGNKEAVEHYKSHLDEFYEKAGIRHVSGEKLELLKDYASAVHDIEDVDYMLDIIMDLSKIRNTATGSWREALSSKTDEIRSKMYRGIEKLGRSQDGGNVKVKEHNPIKRNLKKAFGDDIEALREIAVSQMFGMMSDVEARDLGAKAKTGMFICHLMNGATTFRNILSNAAESGRMNFVNNLGYLIERTFTHKGERTIGWENMFAGGKAGWERMRKSRLETALNVDILKNDTSRLGAPLKKRTFTKGPMAVLERGLGYILGATDEYFKGATEYQVKQGLKRYVDNGRLTQAEADKYAEEQMLYRTFQNDSKIAEFSKDIRNALNRWGIGEADADGIKPFGVGDFINAYPLVSGNVLDRVIDVTPVGALKVVYNSYKLAESTYKNKRDIKAIEMPIDGKVSNESKTAAAGAVKTNHDLKRKTILSISSALTNGALIWAGMALFKNGIITGNPSADEEEDYERAKNNSQYGINISRLGRLLDGDDDGEPKNGDLVMPVGFLGNLYMGLGIGAELVQGNEQEMNFLDNYFSANVMSAKEQFLSMSMISNINRTVNNFKYSDTIGEGFAATGADVLMTALPSVVRQFGNAMDDYGRDPYKGATYLDIISGKFKSKIPKVREGEPLRIDLFGEAEVHTLGNKWADIGNNMLSPGIISKYETNVVTQELDKLTAKNKDLLKEILPKTPYRNNTGEFENGQAYSFKLDDENYEKYANILGMTTYKAMHTLVTSDDYKHLTDTQKTTALAEISKESAELVKEIWVSHQQGASDSSMQKRIDKYVASNKAKASKVVKTDNALKYIKLDGVKVEDVIDAGYRVPYTEEEKGEQIAYNYSMISKIRNGTYYDKSSRKYSSSLTAEQRQQLINSFVRSSEDLASGIEQKWISITGEFKNLTDKEKGIVIDQIGYNIDKVRLPDNVGELVDTSVETEPVDLTYPFVPRTSGIINLDWRADEYDKEQSDKKNAESEEESEEEPESKSVEEYLSEYDGEESSEDYKNYPKKYYKKSYGGKSYGGGYSKKSYGGSYGGGYGFVPSVQPVQKNTYRFTPRFGGSGSRFGKKF